MRLLHSFHVIFNYHCFKCSNESAPFISCDNLIMIALNILSNNNNNNNNNNNIDNNSNNTNNNNNNNNDK